MNKFFDQYADLTALILTATLPLSLTIYLKIKQKKKLRAVAVYFFVFGPLGILSFIFFHLFENGYRAVDATVQHRFTYNFHFYSLILFGCVVAYVAALLLKACLDKCFGKPTANRSYWLRIAVLLLVTAAVIPLTPIAAVPSICCGVSVAAFPFVCRKRIFNSTSAQPVFYEAERQKPQPALPA